MADNWVVSPENGKTKWSTLHLARRKDNPAELVTIKKVSTSNPAGSKSEDRERYRSLHNESKMLNLSWHGSIVSYKDEISLPNETWFVIEHMAQGSLRDLMERASSTNQSFTEPYMSHICKSINDALCYLHTVHAPGYTQAEGFAHGDLRPENVLLDVAGKIKLSNFECMWTTQDRDPDYLPAGYLSGASLMRGAARYSAPEFWDISGNLRTLGISVKMDIWSLGLILFELVEGVLCYSDQSDADLELTAKTNSTFHQYAPTFTYPPRWSSELRHFYAFSTVGDPSLRASAGELSRQEFLLNGCTDWIFTMFVRSVYRDSKVRSPKSSQLSLPLEAKAVASPGSGNSPILKQSSLRNTNQDLPSYTEASSHVEPIPNKSEVPAEPVPSNNELPHRYSWSSSPVPEEQPYIEIGEDEGEFGQVYAGAQQNFNWVHLDGGIAALNMIEGRKRRGKRF